jgi:tRNA (uracil-5-)-methyltransferase TRM9
MQSDNQRTTEETWDAIAESFDTTRRLPWKQCLDYIHTLKNTDIVADIGCGNGRHLLPCADHCQYVIGLDISRKLLNIVQKAVEKKNIQNVSLIHADAVTLPLRNESLNAVLFIASLHNIQGKENRRSALREILRVLKPGGTALISVWSRQQDRYRRFFAHQRFFRRQELGDIDIYWRQHNMSIPRFYHLYGMGEFVQDLRQTGFQIENFQCVKIHSKRFPDNYFAVIRKR